MSSYTGKESRTHTSFFLSFQTLKPTKVEVVSGGLGAITGALERLKKGDVSGKKLVVRLEETKGWASSSL